MAEDDLSPWAHPKAQTWFKALFHRSQFGFILEDIIKQPEDQLTHEQVRAMLTFAVLLSRKEIWPEEHHLVLTMILEKARTFANKHGEPAPGKKLTLSQHRNRDSTQLEFQEEIEILRRRIGRSFKTSTLSTPTTWEPFWT